MKGRCKVPFKETVLSHLSLGWWDQKDLAGEYYVQEIGEQFKHKGHDLLKQKVLLITYLIAISYSSTLPFEVKFFWLYQVKWGFYTFIYNEVSCITYETVHLYKSHKILSTILLFQRSWAILLLSNVLFVLAKISSVESLGIVPNNENTVPIKKIIIMYLTIHF